MATNEYHFVDRWRVRGTVVEVSDIIRDGLRLPEWWPSTYRQVVRLRAGDADGLGAVHRLRAKGFLPYTIRFRFTVVETHHPHGFVIEARGDLSGRGEWTFAQDGEWCDISFDWRITADKALLRLLSPIVKPVLRANHSWTMRRGEESLKLELLRRRAATARELARIPPPPGPFSVLRAGAGLPRAVAGRLVRPRGVLHESHAASR